jgi:lysophospholipase L1-like esterase
MSRPAILLVALAAVLSLVYGLNVRHGVALSDEYVTAGRDFDICFPQIYVQAFAREHGIPYLDLLPIFRAHVADHNRPLYPDGDIHLNQLGHQLAREAIADWFRASVKGG